MSFVVAIGANIQSAPIELLEKMSLDGALLEKYLHDLVQRDNVSEAVILSTCNRCLLYTSDAADDLLCVDLGGRRIIKKKNKHVQNHNKS